MCGKVTGVGLQIKKTGILQEEEHAPGRELIDTEKGHSQDCSLFTSQRDGVRTQWWWCTGLQN